MFFLLLKAPSDFSCDPLEGFRATVTSELYVKKLKLALAHRLNKLLYMDASVLTVWL